MTFLGDAARFDARIEDGRVVINGRKTGISASGHGHGDVAVYCRPWDLRVVPREGADIIGTVHATRRISGTRRVELDVPNVGRVEVDAEASWLPAPGERVGIAVERARIFA